MSRPLLEFGGGSGEILRDLLHLRSVSEAEALIPTLVIPALWSQFSSLSSCLRRSAARSVASRCVMPASRAGTGKPLCWK